MDSALFAGYPIVFPTTAPAGVICVNPWMIEISPWPHLHKLVKSHSGLTVIDVEVSDAFYCKSRYLQSMCDLYSFAASAVEKFAWQWHPLHGLSNLMWYLDDDLGVFFNLSFFCVYRRLWMVRITLHFVHRVSRTIDAEFALNPRKCNSHRIDDSCELGCRVKRRHSCASSQDDATPAFSSSR